MDHLNMIFAPSPKEAAPQTPTPKGQNTPKPAPVITDYASI